MRVLVQYTFVIRGRLRDSLLSAMRPLSVTAFSDTTEMTLEIQDDAELYGILERLERLGLSLVSFAPAAVGNGPHD